MNLSEKKIYDIGRCGVWEQPHFYIRASMPLVKTFFKNTSIMSFHNLNTKSPSKNTTEGSRPCKINSVVHSWHWYFYHLELNHQSSHYIICCVWLQLHQTPSQLSPVFPLNFEKQQKGWMILILKFLFHYLLELLVSPHRRRRFPLKVEEYKEFLYFTCLYTSR